MPTNDGDKHDDHHAIVRLNPNPNPPSLNATTAPSPKPNPRFLSLLLRAIVMALIVSLFLFFLGVAAFALLHIFLAGGALHRHRNRNRPRTTHAPASDAYSAEDLQRFLNRSKYINNLPGTAKDCAVCLDSFREDEWCRSLPSCNHMFHEKCVDNWLTRVPNCPICRTCVRLNSGASASVISNDDYNLLWAVGVGQRSG